MRYIDYFAGREVVARTSFNMALPDREGGTDSNRSGVMASLRSIREEFHRIFEGIRSPASRRGWSFTLGPASDERSETRQLESLQSLPHDMSAIHAGHQ
jgi:hypothetical protein